VVVDGAFGTMVRGGTASFDNFSLKTSDSRFEEPAEQMLMAAQAGAGAVDADALLTQESLDAVVAAAIERWSAALGGADIAAALEGVIFVVGDLDGAALAQTVGSVVVLDESAAGHGWFIDPTPLADEEFAGASNDGEAQAKASGAAVGRIDLLTVVMHEIGHLLGFTHDDAGTAGALMEASLDDGVRRLPEGGVAQPADHEDAGPVATGDAGGTEQPVPIQPAPAPALVDEPEPTAPGNGKGRGRNG
jgi:hypothetical protein